MKYYWYRAIEKKLLGDFTETVLLTWIESICVRGKKILPRIYLTPTLLTFRISFLSIKSEEINFYNDFFYYLCSGQYQDGICDVKWATLYFKFLIQSFLVTPFLVGGVWIPPLIGLVTFYKVSHHC